MPRELLGELKALAQNETCLTCECLQGALASLMVETDDAALRAEAKALRVERSCLHSCLGCDPSPPVDALVTFRARKSGQAVMVEGCASTCGCSP